MNDVESGYPANENRVTEYRSTAPVLFPLCAGLGAGGADAQGGAGTPKKSLASAQAMNGQNPGMNQGAGMNPEAPVAAPRICPTCGMPMKPHWDVCLYCEANHR